MTWEAITAWMTENHYLVRETWGDALKRGWQPISWDADPELRRVYHELITLDHILNPTMRFFMTAKQYTRFVPKHVQQRDAALLARTPLLVAHGPFDTWKVACLDVLPKRDLPLGLWLCTITRRHVSNMFQQFKALRHAAYLALLGYSTSCDECDNSDYVWKKEMFSKTRVMHCTSCDKQVDSRALMALGLVPGINIQTMLRTTDMLAGNQDGRMSCDQTTWPPAWCNALLTSIPTLIVYVGTSTPCPRPLMFLDEFTASVAMPEIHLVVPSAQVLLDIIVRESETWLDHVRQRVRFATLLDDAPEPVLQELEAMMTKFDVHTIRVCQPKRASWLVLQAGQRYVLHPVRSADAFCDIEDSVCASMLDTDRFEFHKDTQPYSFDDVQRLFQHDSRSQDVLRTLPHEWPNKTS